MQRCPIRIKQSGEGNSAGWILHTRVDLGCFSSRYCTQGGSGMFFFQILHTGWIWDVFLPDTAHRVDLGCFTFRYCTQGGFMMFFFQILHTGWIWNVFLPDTSHRVDLGCFTSGYCTQGGSAMFYFRIQHTGWIWDFLRRWTAQVQHKKTTQDEFSGTVGLTRIDDKCKFGVLPRLEGNPWGKTTKVWLWRVKYISQAVRSRYLAEKRHASYNSATKSHQSDSSEFSVLWSVRLIGPDLFFCQNKNSYILTH